MLNKLLPYSISGIVCKGFGRGSKELGIPTANYSDEVVNSLPSGFETGVYFGWCQIDDGPVYKMVMSMGWNPFYNNTQKTMEIHILHEFDKTFYGSVMKACILQYMRPEMDFNSVEDLITAIKNDIKVASSELDKSEYAKFKDCDFFTNTSEVFS